jgi:hypothetical protein
LNLERCLKVVVPKGMSGRRGCLILRKRTADSVTRLERRNRPAIWRADAVATGVVDQITTTQG